MGLAFLALPGATAFAEESGPARHSHAMVEWVAFAVDSLAVAVIVLGVGLGTIVYLTRIVRRSSEALAAYEVYKRQVGRSLLLALELLVASDVLMTVVMSPTLENVSILGILVLIRTFLSWSLGVEIEGRWPWQRRTRTGTGEE